MHNKLLHVLHSQKGSECERRLLNDRLWHCLLMQCPGPCPKSSHACIARHVHDDGVLLGSCSYPTHYSILLHLLREAKADITIPNKQGKTAAEIAKTPEVAEAVTK
eukprot:226516-Pelagomonas_calceolata.AAC.2